MQSIMHRSMWQSRDGGALGLVSPHDLIRMPTGSMLIYETASRDAAERLRHTAISNSRAIGGRVTTKTWYSFSYDGIPAWLLRVEVITPGAARVTNHTPPPPTHWRKENQNE